MTGQAPAGNRPDFRRRPELIVAEKEFRDHVTSKRFIIVFGILLLLAVYSLNAGMNNYNQKLGTYKNDRPDPMQSYTQYQINDLQQRILEAQENGESPESLAGLQEQFYILTHPPMPTAKDVFQSMTLVLTVFGMVLGAAMGFDQISREKDEGSAKFLVSSPIFRDAIINGKTIAAIAMLAVAMAAAFTIALAIIMLQGVIPGPDDMVRIALFYLATMLYCTVFFAIAMMVSTIAKNTTTAAIITVGVVVFLAIYALLSYGLALWIADAITGPAPDGIRGATSISYSVANGTNFSYNLPDMTEIRDYDNKRDATLRQWSDLLTTLSPVNAFGGTLGTGNAGIASTLLTTPASTYYISGEHFVTSITVYKEMSLLDALAGVWIKMLVILVEIMAAFGIAYTAFMRMDIR